MTNFGTLLIASGAGAVTAVAFYALVAIGIRRLNWSTTSRNWRVASTVNALVTVFLLLFVTLSLL